MPLMYSKRPRYCVNKESIVMTSRCDVLRQRFCDALLLQHLPQAIRYAADLLQEDPSARQVSFIHNTLRGIPQGQLRLTTFKVALLSSFSLEFIYPYLIVYGFLNGLKIDIYQAGFGQFRQEILDANSGLFAFSPDAIIIAVEGTDLVPPIYYDYQSIPDSGLVSVISNANAEIEVLLKTFRAGSKATVLIHNFIPPIWKQLGILDCQAPRGQTRLIHKLNEDLVTTCGKYS